MGANKNNWTIIIPLIVWGVCIGLSVAKIFQNDSYRDFASWLDMITSNTFSTFVSMVLYMMYQYFSAENYRKSEASGLSRKYISLTIISTCVYSGIMIINASRYNVCTCVLAIIASVLYVFLFFRYMRAK